MTTHECKNQRLIDDMDKAIFNKEYGLENKISDLDKRLAVLSTQLKFLYLFNIATIGLLIKLVFFNG